MSGLKDLSGAELVYAAASFALALAQDFGPDELAVLSSFFSAVGDGLGLIAAQEALQGNMQECKKAQPAVRAPKQADVTGKL
ncbi:MAG: hypothetical protein ACOX66_09315 [Oscillospiraceae bacterium]|jgi:hypothetical protein